MINNIRKFNMDIGKLAKAKNYIYFFSEIDVTNYIRTIKPLRISFSAFCLKILCDLIKTEYSFIVGLRRWNSIIELKSDDVEIQIEKVIKERNVPIAYILRNVNEKSSTELTQEIEKLKDKIENGQHWFAFLPSFLRKAFLAVIIRNPKMVVKYFGSFAITSVGSISKYCGFVQPYTISPFCIAIGSKKEVEDKILQNITFVFDHDLIDGGDCGRFIDRFQQAVRESLA